jgi:hypothetical protein
LSHGIADVLCKAWRYFLGAEPKGQKILPGSSLSVFWNCRLECPENRMYLFVGDLLLRQVFISIACLNWDLVEKIMLSLFEKRGVRTANQIRLKWPAFEIW